MADHIEVRLRMRAEDLATLGELISGQAEEAIEMAHDDQDDARAGQLGHIAAVLHAALKEQGLEPTQWGVWTLNGKPILSDEERDRRLIDLVQAEEATLDDWLQA